MSCRAVISLFAAVLVLASPLLACVPSPSMTPAEMECCRKMAGNCDMGGGNHKCCSVTMTYPTPIAAIIHNGDGQATAVPMIVIDSWSEGSSPRVKESLTSSLVLVVSSPPGFTAVLRL